MTTIKLFDGDLGIDGIMVRCDLTQAASPVQANYMTGDEEPGHEWQSTQYQCADARHRTSGLIEIGKRLAARAVEMPYEEFDCEAEEVEEPGND